jgi:hypothetical protein
MFMPRLFVMIYDREGLRILAERNNFIFYKAELDIYMVYKKKFHLLEKKKKKRVCDNQDL